MHPIVDRPAPASERLQATLREVIERLASIERTPCSTGEREAARWIAARLRRAGVEQVALEQEPSWGAFHPQVAALGALGVLAAVLAVAHRRPACAACALLSIAGVVDEAQNGPRVLRRALRRKRATVNVVGRAGDHRAERTLVVLAHHDAAQTGRFYEQRLTIGLHKRWPRLIGRARRQPPQWWLGLASPVCALATMFTRRRGPALAGILLGTLGTAAVADMWRSPTVPGASDNLSGVAAITALAELLHERPIPLLRVLLVSCGAEETLQDGIRGFIASHRHELAPSRTWFLNLDTIGSPHLVMLEGEGPIWMEDYTDPSFRDLVELVARERGIVLERGLRARASTDSIIPSRAGYASAFLGSVADWRMPANYHLMSDLPQNVDYATVADATVLAYALADRLPGSRRPV